jgi:hypothetical protein
METIMRAIPSTFVSVRVPRRRDPHCFGHIVILIRLDERLAAALPMLTVKTELRSQSRRQRLFQSCS